MKKVLVVLGLFLFCIISSYGQRRAGGYALKTSVGIMRGKGEILQEIGSTASLGMSHIIGNSHFLVDVDFVLKDFSTEYQEQNLYNRFYGMKLQGAYTIENLEPLYINFKVGGFAGFEQVNKGKLTENVYGIALPHPVDNFVYGVVASPEIEIILLRKLNFIVNYSQYFGISSKYTDLYYSVEAGIKYNF